MHFSHTFVSLAAAALFATPAAAQLSPRRIVLPLEAEVHADVIWLADLLPAGAPPTVRESAQKLSLGAAPQPGSTRVLAQEMIASRIGPAGDLDSLVIPPHVVVRRAGRLVTAGEVFEAIRKSLDHNGFPEARTIRPEDIRMGAPVSVSSQSAGLEVTRMDFDAALHQVRFLLVPRAERNALPFLVTVRMGAASVPVLPLRPVPVKKVFLVQPGHRALLRIVSASMQVLLGVTPLERGVSGQEIRVRLPRTGKILRAQVVGPNHLEASF